MQVLFAGGLKGQIENRFRQWANRSGLAGLLVPLRELVWLSTKVRNALHPLPEVRVPVPVISVGNMTVGGTGKTPLTHWLLRRLVRIGHRPAVLTPVRENSDEIREHLLSLSSLNAAPLVLGGRDRGENAQKAVSLGATVIILDDGFQYRRLCRDIDLVLWDATVPFHPNNPLLREPLSHLKRATLVIVSKADSVSAKERDRLCANLRRWVGDGKVVAAFGYEPIGVQLPDGEVKALESLEVRKVLLVAGIGNPNYFAFTARRAGFEVAMMICFPDHHQYDHGDVKFIVERARLTGVDAVLTTQKDAIKLLGIWQSDLPLLTLRVKLNWLWGEGDLWEIIESSLTALKAG